MDCDEFRVSLDSLLDGRCARLQRLFACACARTVLYLSANAENKFAVRIAELFADGLASPRDLLNARSAAWKAAWSAGYSSARSPSSSSAYNAARSSARAAAWSAVMAAGAASSAAWTRIQVLFEVIFCDSTVFVHGRNYDPGCLQIAQVIYCDREFGMMPFLADCLEEAGARQEAVNACRESPETWVLGHWVLDSLLGKRFGNGEPRAVDAALP